MKKNILVTIVLLSFLLVIPILSILVSESTQDTRSRASEEKVLPVLPPLSPFIRVGKSKDHVKKGELVPIYISAKSNDQAVVEAQIALSYDPEQFVLDEKNIRNENVFSTLSVTSVLPGKAIFSLFVNTENGYTPVELREEETIATVFLTVVGESEEAVVKLLREGEEKTALFTQRDQTTGIVPDILSSTQDVRIRID